MSTPVVAVWRAPTVLRTPLVLLGSLMIVLGVISLVTWTGMLLNAILHIHQHARTTPLGPHRAAISRAAEQAALHTTPDPT